MNAPSTSTTNSARHRCFMLSPNADERGSLDANSYQGRHVFSGANLRMSTGSVKENASCFTQYPAIATSFRNSFSIAELQKRDQIFSRKSEHISKLCWHIHLPRYQLRLEPRHHRFERAPVVKAI